VKELVASWWACRAARASTPRSSRAASSSASRWRARWPPSRGCCCWTSRCRRWTLVRVRLRSGNPQPAAQAGRHHHHGHARPGRGAVVADRIVVMNHGVIEQVGTPMEVYREPATPFVADFVGKRQRAARACWSRPACAWARACTTARSTPPPPRAPTCACTCAPRTCWRGRSRRATATCSRPRSTRSSSSAPTAMCA
jgi:hypothetical protein